MAVAQRFRPHTLERQQLDGRRYLELIAVQAERALKVRYRGSALGVYWSLLNPLFMTAVYTVIFGTAFAVYYGGSIVNYVLACFVGLTALNFYSQTSSQALSSIVGNGALLNKLEIPFSVFPLSAVSANLFQFVVGALPILIVLTLIRTHNPLNVALLLVPIAALMLFTTGMSLLTATLFVFFRDLPYLYELVVSVLWFTSPIFYPATLVPATVRPYIALNPLAEIIDGFRSIVFVPGPSNLHALAYSLLGGGIALAVGIVAFAGMRRSFMDLL